MSASQDSSNSAFLTAEMHQQKILAELTGLDNPRFLRLPNMSMCQASCLLTSADQGRIEDMDIIASKLAERKIEKEVCWSTKR